jgi:hypothetical protein
MRSFIRTHPITAFLVIACVLVGAGFTLPLLPEDGLGVIPVDLPGVGPSIVVAALALSIQCDGPSSPSSLALNRACAPLTANGTSGHHPCPSPRSRKRCSGYHHSRFFGAAKRGRDVASTPAGCGGGAVTPAGLACRTPGRQP